MASVGRTYCSTDRTTGATKRVAPALPDETPEQRERRLGRQAAANRIRARKQPDGSWLVDSQHRTETGSRARPPYRVDVVEGIGLACECTWSLHHPGSTCAHIAQILKQIQREARQTSDMLAQVELAYIRYCAQEA